jgi:signal transduction histidine kinase
MGLLQRHRWFVTAAGITLAFSMVSRVAHRSDALTAFADLVGLSLLLAAVGITLANTLTRPKHERSFWAPMMLGFALWTTNQIAWTYWESLTHRQIPDPFFFDIILFFHTVPMIAAIAWRPDLVKKEGKVGVSLLHFGMLLSWWIFLYAFIVFPHQYVVFNVHLYDVCYDGLFAVENALLLAVLAIAAWTSSGGWRRLYFHLLGASLLYAIDSQLLDRAAADNTYYSGSWYDIPFVGSLAWMAAAFYMARRWDLKPLDSHLNLAPWRKLVPRLAMLAILSLPVIGLWTVLFDRSPAPSRVFRVLTVLAAMLVLGAFVFLRQYLQDRTLVALLKESRRSFDTEKRLHNQLVQREKLSSLGTLVASAAHEISLPLTGVMDYSEQLWSQAGLGPEQNALLRKIVHQAQRTRDLVGNLLSFAQQNEGEKVLVDIGQLLQRAAQILESRYSGGGIHTALSIDRELPRISGNANQLFQVFVEIIENAMDALQELGGGSLEIAAERQGSETILRFSDTGPGLREPERVFDPFYTTKSVGKGTGLGLSVAYGVVRDHGGQISCQNKPEGGALFIVKFPAAAEAAAQFAEAAGH